MLGTKIPGALIAGTEIFDLPMIGFEQRNGINRILRLIVPVSHVMLSSHSTGFRGKMASD
jgi:hypothetical protein